MKALLDHVARYEQLVRLEMNAAPPLFLARYELRAVVGLGSFGAVFRAWDRVLERQVALKLTMAPSLGEARSLAAVNHPHVVTVHDAGQHDEGVFIAMELLEGVGLRDWAKRCQREAVARVCLKILSGLAAIHEAGLAHADIKPSNVLVVERGPVIVDLGLAGSGLTGSTRYMAPELGAGGVPTALTDQYSCCLMLLELFEHELREAAIAVLSRGAQPSPARRWPNTRALRRALRRA